MCWLKQNEIQKAKKNCLKKKRGVSIPRELREQFEPGSI